MSIKKVGGVYKITPGEGYANQHDMLIKLETTLNKTTAATGEFLCGNVNTYKHWKSERRTMNHSTLMLVKMIFFNIRNGIDTDLF